MPIDIAEYNDASNTADLVTLKQLHANTTLQIGKIKPKT